MLSRAFTKPRRSPRNGDHNDGSKSGSILEYEDCLVGFMDDLPLVFCGEENTMCRLSLREILRGSVGVMGESCLGMTEKVVLLQGKVYALKRFRQVNVGRREFGRRVERLAQVSKKCEYLVPVTAYLYSKRIKFVVSDYYPMGSLADLLAGGRELGHSALDWNQRLMIGLSIARAIAFIHAQCPRETRNMKMNVHGNVKASNVLININFTARLSGYGLTQLAECEEVSDSWHRTPPPPPPKSPYCKEVSQKSDVYNFGMILLEMLGGPTAPHLTGCIVKSKKEIQEGEVPFFEFPVEGKERKQALQVLDLALLCANNSPEDRPAIEQIMKFLGDVIVK